MGSRRGWSLMRTLQPDPLQPPPTLGGAIQVVCPRGHPVYRRCSVASGTSPAGPMGREALSAPWDPFNCCGGTHRPWDAAPAVRHHHPCRVAIKECGASLVGPQAPPSPVPRQSWGGQAVCLYDLEAALPWPVSPLVGSVSGSPSLPSRAQARSTGLTHSPWLPSNRHVQLTARTPAPAPANCGLGQAQFHCVTRRACSTPPSPERARPHTPAP